MTSARRGDLTTYQSLIFRPSPDRQDEFFGVYVLEPGIFHPSFEVQAGTRFDARVATRFDKNLIEFLASMFIA